MTTEIKIRYLRDFFAGYKVPRKIKKALLDRKLSSCALKRQLKKVKVVETFPTMYETPTIEPHLFCPHCGETGFTSNGNMTTYPEHWEIFKCLRCKSTVATIDNSPFIHALEYVKGGVLQHYEF